MNDTLRCVAQALHHTAAHTHARKHTGLAPQKTHSRLGWSRHRRRRSCQVRIRLPWPDLLQSVAGQPTAHWSAKWKAWETSRCISVVSHPRMWLWPLCV
jgi:hypothetical protein